MTLYNGLESRKEKRKGVEEKAKGLEERKDIIFSSTKDESRDGRPRKERPESCPNADPRQLKQWDPMQNYDKVVASFAFSLDVAGGSRGRSIVCSLGYLNRCRAIIQRGTLVLTSTRLCVHALARGCTAKWTGGLVDLRSRDRSWPLLGSSGTVCRY